MALREAPSVPFTPFSGKAPKEKWEPPSPVAARRVTPRAEATMNALFTRSTISAESNMHTWR
jgi:hypothetical protein